MTINESRTQPVKLAGGSQCDLPGKTVKYSSYFLLDITTNYIVHVEIMDKRIVGVRSAAMEPGALKKSIQSLI